MKLKLFLLLAVTVLSFSVNAQTDTGYTNMLKRLNKTVPFKFIIGGGVGYKFYFDNSDMDDLWAGLVPEHPDPEYTGSSSFGFEFNLKFPFSDNVAVGIFVSQSIKIIRKDYNINSGGQTVIYFGKPYSLPPGIVNRNTELGLSTLDLGGSLTYFPVRKGAWGINFLTPFFELDYGITLLRGKFIAEPFGEIERFRRASPSYFSVGGGFMLTSRNAFAGITFKIKGVYSDIGTVLTADGKEVNYTNGSPFMPKFSHIGISLIGNYIFQ